MATRSPSGSATFNSDGTLLQIVNLQNMFFAKCCCGQLLIAHIANWHERQKLCKLLFWTTFFLQIVASDKLRQLFLQIVAQFFAHILQIVFFLGNFFFWKWLFQTRSWRVLQLVVLSVSVRSIGSNIMEG